MSTNTKNKNQASKEEREPKQNSHAAVEATSFDDEIKTLWKNMMKSAGSDMLAGSVTSVSEQILGSGPSTVGAQLQEGQAVSLKQQQQQAEKAKKQEKAEVIARSSEFAEYKREVINADRISDRRTEQQVTQAVDQIRMEIQKLVKTSKLVENTVKDATASQAPMNPGKYHIHFFEFVLSVIKDATQKLEDTVSFGAVFQSKKQQSKYWNSYKKSGTSFGLSGERTVATQVG